MIKLPKETQDLYLAAIEEEAAAWRRWGPAKPLSRAETQKVLRDKILMERAMRSRTLYREKNCGRVEILAKARLVLTGSTDPDLHRLARNSPTCTRIAFLIVLQHAAGGWADGWSLVVADICTAFLQGQQDQTERTGKLYMRAPSDESQSTV